MVRRLVLYACIPLALILVIASALPAMIGLMLEEFRRA